VPHSQASIHPRHEPQQHTQGSMMYTVGEEQMSCGEWLGVLSRAAQCAVPVPLRSAYRCSGGEMCGTRVAGNLISCVCVCVCPCAAVAPPPWRRRLPFIQLSHGIGCRRRQCAWLVSGAMCETDQTVSASGGRQYLPGASVCRRTQTIVAATPRYQLSERRPTSTPALSRRCCCYFAANAGGGAIILLGGLSWESPREVAPLSSPDVLR